MSNPDEAAEQRLLRSISRRNGLRGLVVTAPALVLWWLLSHWMMRRYDIDPRLAMFGTPFLAAPLLGVLIRRLGPDQVRDPRETPRLRWLLKQRSGRIASRVRRVWIVCTLLAVLLWVPAMLFDRGHTSDLTDGWPVLLMLMGTCGPNLPWRLPKAMDEPERARYLVATHRAHAATTLLCVGALILDRYWPGRLPGLITLSLLIGILAQQAGLEVSGARAGPRDA